MVDIYEKYKFDLGVKGLSPVGKNEKVNLTILVLTTKYCWSTSL